MDYYNDFQRMVRSNHIEDVIDRYREWRVTGSVVSWYLSPYNIGGVT